MPCVVGTACKVQNMCILPERRSNTPTIESKCEASKGTHASHRSASDVCVDVSFFSRSSVLFTWKGILLCVYPEKGRVFKAPISCQVHLRDVLRSYEGRVDLCRCFFLLSCQSAVPFAIVNAPVGPAAAASARDQMISMLQSVQSPPALACWSALSSVPIVSAPPRTVASTGISTTQPHSSGVLQRALHSPAQVQPAVQRPILKSVPHVQGYWCSLEDCWVNLGHVKCKTCLEWFCPQHYALVDYHPCFGLQPVVRSPVPRFLSSFHYILLLLAHPSQPRSVLYVHWFVCLLLNLFRICLQSLHWTNIPLHRQDPNRRLYEFFATSFSCRGSTAAFFSCFDNWATPYPHYLKSNVTPNLFAIPSVTFRDMSFCDVDTKLDLERYKTTLLTTHTTASFVYNNPTLGLEETRWPKAAQEADRQLMNSEAAFVVHIIIGYYHHRSCCFFPVFLQVVTS
jgi:hypothetical protein